MFRKDWKISRGKLSSILLNLQDLAVKRGLVVDRGTVPSDSQPLKLRRHGIRRDHSQNKSATNRFSSSYRKKSTPFVAKILRSDSPRF